MRSSSGWARCLRSVPRSWQFSWAVGLAASLAGCPKPATAPVIDLGEEEVRDYVPLQFALGDGWRAEVRTEISVSEGEGPTWTATSRVPLRVLLKEGSTFLVWGAGSVESATPGMAFPVESWVGLHRHLAETPFVERIEADGSFSGAGSPEALMNAQNLAFEAWRATRLDEGLEGRALERAQEPYEAARPWFSEAQAQAVLRESNERLLGRWLLEPVERGVERLGNRAVFVPEVGAQVVATVRARFEGEEPCPQSHADRCVVLFRDSEADTRLLTRELQRARAERSKVLGDEPGPALSLVEAQRVERVWLEAETMRPWKSEDTLVVYVEDAAGEGSARTTRMVRTWDWRDAE